MRKIVYIIVAILLLSACGTTKKVEPVVVERVRTDTLYQVKNVHLVDTCWQHDSVTITERGADRWRTIYKVKIVEHIDTILKITHDTIPKIVTVETIKEKRVLKLADEVILTALLLLCSIGTFALLRKR